MPRRVGAKPRYTFTPCAVVTVRVTLGRLWQAGEFGRPACSPRRRVQLMTGPEGMLIGVFGVDLSPQAPVGSSVRSGPGKGISHTAPTTLSMPRALWPMAPECLFPGYHPPEGSGSDMAAADCEQAGCPCVRATSRQGSWAS